jgi:hypothetical protein
MKDVRKQAMLPNVPFFRTFCAENIVNRRRRRTTRRKSRRSNNNKPPPDNRNHLKIIQKIPVQHTGKAQHRENTKTATLCTAHVLWKVLM